MGRNEELSAYNYEIATGVTLIWWVRITTRLPTDYPNLVVNCHMDKWCWYSVCVLPQSYSFPPPYLRNFIPPLSAVLPAAPLSLSCFLPLLLIQRKSEHRKCRKWRYYMKNDCVGRKTNRKVTTLVLVYSNAFASEAGILWGHRMVVEVFLLSLSLSLSFLTIVREWPEGLARPKYSPWEAGKVNGQLWCEASY